MPRNPGGRPKIQTYLHLNKVDESIEAIVKLIESGKSNLEKVQLFANELNKVLATYADAPPQQDRVVDPAPAQRDPALAEDVPDQPEEPPEHERKDTEPQPDAPDFDTFVDNLDNLEENDLIFLLSQTFECLPEDEKVICLIKHFKDLNLQQQNRYFLKIGEIFNAGFLEQSKRQIEFTKTATFDDLSDVTLKEFYETCDERFRSLLAGATQNTTKDKNRKHAQNLPFLCHAYASVLKARHKLCVSNVALRDNSVIYVSSKQNTVTSDVTRQYGGGGRPVLNKVISNTTASNEFSPPPNVTTFYSMDNIQKMQHTNGVSNTVTPAKPLVIVVTSAQATLPDGLLKSDVQYKIEWNPAFWNTNIFLNKKTNCLNDKLETKILKECIDIPIEEKELVHQTFMSEFLKQAKEVQNDLKYDSNFENFKDNVDRRVTEDLKQNTKLCLKGHINVLLRSNQRKCSRKGCTANLISNTSEPLSSVPESSKISRAEYFLGVENKNLNAITIEKSLGTFNINPNNKKRVKKALDRIVKESQVKPDAVKIRVTENIDIEKIVEYEDEDKSRRCWILITTDGLPYKMLIEIIRENYTCTECQKKLFLTEIMEHILQSNHRIFYQTYGSVLPNIGRHQTCKRGLTIRLG